MADATINTSNPLPTSLTGGTSTVGKVGFSEQVAGENLTQDVHGVTVKPVIDSQYSANLSSAIGNDVDVLAKATPGHLLGVYGFNDNASPRFMQIFNGTVAPSTGGTPLLSFLVKADSEAHFGRETFGEAGHYFSSGISWGFSTAMGTFAAATTSDHIGHVFYV